MSFKGGILGPHTVLPVAISCPVLFSWISPMVWNHFPFKGDFSFGENQKSQGTKSALLGGWVIWVIWCFTKRLYMRCDAWADTLFWWSCQSPGAYSCSLLSHPNSLCGGMFKLNTKFDADSLLYLLIYSECDSYTVHTLTQWHLPSPQPTD